MVKKIPNYVRNMTGISRGIKKFGMQKRLVKEIKKRAGKVKLLEIGCGKGILLLELRKKFSNLELYGINLNRYHGVKEKKDFIKNAEENKISLTKKEKSNLPKINFGDAGKKLPYKENSFDIIISNVSFVHIRNKARALEEIYRVLKIGGVAFISFDVHEIKKVLGKEYHKLHKKLDKELKEDYIPRFLMKVNNKFLGKREFFQRIKKKGFDIKVKNTEYQDKSQKVRGFK